MIIMFQSQCYYLFYFSEEKANLLRKISAEIEEKDLHLRYLFYN